MKDPESNQSNDSYFGKDSYVEVQLAKIKVTVNMVAVKKIENRSLIIIEINEMIIHEIIIQKKIIHEYIYRINT